MKDPYVYPHTGTLKNLANIKDDEKLSCMEAEYTSIRIAELVTQEFVSHFDFTALCYMHYYIFQDVFEWAGKIRVINIEKAEPALGGISIEYSDSFDIEKDTVAVLHDMNQYSWEVKPIETIAKVFSGYMAALWKVHPYREGNTRTIVTFCSQFIESKGLYIDSELFKDHAQYMRTALVAASAVFSDLGDKRKTKYLEDIVLDALLCGQEMKIRVSEAVEEAGYPANEENVRKIIWWNRAEQIEHSSEAIHEYMED